MKRWLSLSGLLAIVPLAASAPAHAQSDERDFPIERYWQPQEVSIRMTLACDDTSAGFDRATCFEPRTYELADGLFLRVIPERDTRVSTGVFGFYFQLAKDDAGTETIRSTDQPGHGITEDSVNAFHFRNIDNTGPNEIGEKNLNAPGALRVVEYDGIEMQLRVLAIDIVGAKPGATPSFRSLDCLVTVRIE
jgi:hypothetical protein